MVLLVPNRSRKSTFADDFEIDQSNLTGFTIVQDIVHSAICKPIYPCLINKKDMTGLPNHHSTEPSLTDPPDCEANICKFESFDGAGNLLYKRAQY